MQIANCGMWRGGEAWRLAGEFLGFGEYWLRQGVREFEELVLVVQHYA
jgi:hypothetical protein